MSRNVFFALALSSACAAVLADLSLSGAVLAQSMTAPVIENNNDTMQLQAIRALAQGKNEQAVKNAEAGLERAKAATAGNGIVERGRENEVSRLDQQVLASSYAVLGKVYRRVNRYADSIDAYQEALSYWKRDSVGDIEAGTGPKNSTARNATEVEAIILNNMGEEYKAMKLYDKALDALLEAQSKMEPTAPGYCAIEENLGAVYLKQEKLTEAEDSWNKALEAAQKGNDRRSEVDVMCNLTSLFVKQHRQGAAHSMADQAISKIESYFGPTDSRIVTLRQVLDEK